MIKDILGTVESLGKFLLGLLLLMHAFGLLQAQFGYWLLVLCAIFLIGTGAWELYQFFAKTPQTM